MQGIQSTTSGSGVYFIPLNPENINTSRSNSLDGINSIIESTRNFQNENKNSICEKIKLLNKAEAYLVENYKYFPNVSEVNEKLSNIYLNRGRALFLISKIKDANNDYIKALMLGLQDPASEEILFSSFLEIKEKDKVFNNKLKELFNLKSKKYNTVPSTFNTIPSTFFAENPLSFNSSSATEELASTPSNQIRNTLHLANCLKARSPLNNDPLHILARDIIAAYKQEKLKTPSLIREIIPLAKIKDPIIHADLINAILADLKESSILDRWLIQSLAVIVYNTPKDLYADKDKELRRELFENLVSILKFTINHSEHSYPLANELKIKALLIPIAQFLDRIVDNEFIIDYKELYQPLEQNLKRLIDINHNLKYQACYALQTLFYIKNNNNIKLDLLKKGFKIIAAPIYLGSAIKTLDPDKFLDFIKYSSQALVIIKESLIEKGAWYIDLRIIDHLFAQNKIIELEKFAWNSISCQNEYFLQGFCEYLARIARTQPSLAIQAKVFLNSFKLATHWGRNETVIAKTEELLDMLDQVESYAERNNAPPVWDPWWQLPSNDNKLLDIALKRDNSNQSHISYNEMKNKIIMNLVNAIEKQEEEKVKLYMKILKEMI